MHFIYVLKSVKDGKLYIGCTSNIENRLKMHNSGKVRSTKFRAPFKIAFTESFPDKYDAFRREQEYKTAKGKKILKNKIVNH